MQPIALEGPTMGAGWRVLLASPPAAGLARDLQATADAIDAQMSTWKPGSDLNRLNGAEPGEWVTLPHQLVTVLQLGLEIGALTAGAFDMSVGKAVTAWGFGPSGAQEDAQPTAAATPRAPAIEIADADRRVRRRNDDAIDLSAIAKGYGVDALARCLAANGVAGFIAEIDGEIVTSGARPDGDAWTIEVEQAPGGAVAPVLIAPPGLAAATSGDWRNTVERNGRRYTHIIDPATGAPIDNSLAAVTVLDPACARADALATALMVMGETRGPDFAAAHAIAALFQIRTAAGIALRSTAGFDGFRV